MKSRDNFSGRLSVLRAAARIAAGLTLAAPVVAGPVWAAPVAGANSDSNDPGKAKKPDAPESDVVVITGIVERVGNLAPAVAPLDTRTPTSVITRTWIENSVPDTTDFTGIAMITPSLSGESNNGPGLSEKDVVMRGFGDGEYNVTYDGVPFGDTNDPTHHSTAQFPGSTIGAVKVDRGPGDAGNLGQATFGGSVNLFSRALTAEPYAQFKATLGSWNTRNYTTTLQSGEIEGLGGARATANFEHLTSEGYLSFARVNQANEFVKLEKDLGENLKLTALATHNHGVINNPDNPGATLAQVAKYGKAFSMTDNPTLPTFYKFNTVEKDTDMEYLRLDGDPVTGFTFQNTLYSYAYHNDTRSATNTTQSANDILLNRYPGQGTKAAPTGNKDVAGYYKLNAYRVYGDILRATYDIPFGQIRGGLWYEISNTNRHRYDIDRTLGIPNPIEKPPASGPVPDASLQFLETSEWTQYQPFIDVDIHPIANLTITPGVKYLNFERRIDSPIESKTRLVNAKGSQTFEKTLSFLSANYGISDQLSIYGQYAQGFLVPPLKVFYVPSDSTHAGLKPQQSANYQAGAVFHAGDLSLDGDVYYIEFTDKFTQIGSSSDPFYANIPGTTTYKGVEGEVTYAINDDLAIFANGSINSAQDPSGAQITNAPKWTAALGLVYKSGDWNFTWVSKFTGEQWAASGEPVAYRIGDYNLTNLIGGYEFDRFKIQLGVYNLFDSQNVTDITVNDAAGTLAADSHDQYFFQAERNFQLTLRATF